MSQFKHKFAFLSFIGIVLFACSPEPKPILEVVEYTSITKDSCFANPSHSFFISEPVQFSDSPHKTVILVFDPHGDGHLAASKILEAVQNISFAIMGDNEVRNNHPNYLQLIDELVNEAKSRFQIKENKIILAGFSGGARMAMNYASQKEVKGVLMLGAGPTKNKPNCPLYAISGNQDFNFRENYYRPEISVLKKMNFTTDFFDGKHNWPPTQLITDGILFLNKTQYPTLSSIRSQELLNDYENSDSLSPFEKWKKLEKAYKISMDFEIKKEVEELARECINEDDFRNSIKQIEGSIEKEENARRILFQNSENPETSWWERAIAESNRNLEINTGDKLNYHHRIRAFMGILLFSRLNQWIRDVEDHVQIEILLPIFQELEPENPDAFFLEALYYFQTDYDRSMKALNKSLDLGYKDRVKLKTDFPEVNLD